MARILICEPDPDVRALLTFVVRRGGHEAIVSDGTPEQARLADAIVFEPGDETGLEIACWARDRAPGVSLICASIFPPGEATEELRPDAFLQKPFRLDTLGAALTRALGDGGSGSSRGGSSQRTRGERGVPHAEPDSRSLPPPEAGDRVRPPTEPLASQAEDLLCFLRTTPGLPALAPAIQDPSSGYELSLEDETVPEDWRTRVEAIKRRRRFVLIHGGRYETALPAQASLSVG